MNVETNPDTGVEAEADVIEGEFDVVETDPNVQTEQVEGEEGNQDDDEDYEHDGQTYRLPKALAAVVKTAATERLLQADYTRKTQEVAETRRALASRETALAQQAEVQTALIGDQVRVHALKEQVEQYRQVDWQRAFAEDGPAAQAAYAQFTVLKDNLATAEGEVAEKVQQQTLESQRELATRIQQGLAELPKIIPGWNAETEKKLIDFARSEGVTDEELRNASANPRDIRFLHLARIGAEAVAQQAKARTQLTAQKTKPVTQVRGAGGKFTVGAETNDFAAFEKLADDKLKA